MKRLARGILLGPGSAACDMIRRGVMMTGDGIGIGLYDGDSGVAVTGDVGVYGGGGAGFITTSGKGPPRFFFSEEEDDSVEDVGDVGVCGCAPRASSFCATTVRCGCGWSNVRS